MTHSEQFTPSVDLTIFPRINYLKQFLQRADLRARNGRIYKWTYVPFIDDPEYYPPADGSTCIDSIFPKDLGPDVATTPTNLFDLRDDCGSPSTYDLQTGDNTIAPELTLVSNLPTTTTLDSGTRSTINCAATGNFEISYTWQIKKADNSGWVTANPTNLAAQYPDALFTVFDYLDSNEPQQSSFTLRWEQGAAMPQIRCRIRDTRADGQYDQLITTTNLSYS